MALAHSRGTSCAAPRCVPRITVVVIRSAPNAAMSQARTSRDNSSMNETNKDNNIDKL